MLFVNNKELKRDMPEWARYQKFLDEVLPELPDTVIFKRRRPIQINEGTKLTEVDPRIFIPYEAIDYDRELGSQHWRYCETAPTKNERGKWIYKPLGKNDFKRSYAVDKSKRPDFIFFMMELCHKTKDGTIICEDRRKEARQAIEKEDKVIAVKYMIYNSMSPLSPQNTGSEDTLRMISAAWGVPYAHNKNKSIDEIRVELYSLIEANEKRGGGEKSRGFDTFLTEIKSKERVLLRANIQRAVDNRVITYDKKDFTWKYEGSDQHIVTISTRYFSNPPSGLFDYFLTNEDKKRVFYEILEDKYSISGKVEEEQVKEPEKEEEPKSNLTVGDLEDMDSDTLRETLDGLKYWDLAGLASEKYGLNVKGRKKPQIIEDITGYLAARKLETAE